MLLVSHESGQTEDSHVAEIFFCISLITYTSVLMTPGKLQIGILIVYLFFI
jgi:hypothetical protein